MGRSVILLVNTSKPEANEAAKELRELIERHGSVAAQLAADSSPLPADLPKANLIVVLGGDGTLLSQSRRCLPLGVPLLGINLGQIGFMAEFDMAAMRAQAERIFSVGRLELRRLGLIHAEVHSPGAGRPRFAGPALNDCVITAGPPYRLVSLQVSIDGTPGPTVNGDGLIISTPTGSTAYNLSAGGPILAPNVEGLAVTPIAAQSVGFRPIVVARESSIEIVAQRVNHEPGGQGTTLVMDGQVQTPLLKGDRLTVRSHGQHVQFVRNPATDYWSRLISKLHWARPPTTRGG